MPRRDEPHPMGLEVARRIKQIRAERGLSLDRLAFESGVAKGHLSNVERGLAVITVATLARIADGLGVDAFYLLVSPEKSVRHRYVEHSRPFSDRELRQMLKQLVQRHPHG